MLREVDEFSLLVYFQLREAYNELKNEVGEFNNIIGIFFHELMIYITNFNLILNSTEKYQQPIEFPFLNTSYVKNPYILEFRSKDGNMITTKFLLKNFRGIILKFLSNLLSLNPFIGIKKLGISNPYSFKKIELIKILSKYKTAILTDDVKCYLPQKGLQLDFLRKTLSNSFDFVGTPKKEILSESFINYIQCLISDRKDRVNFDFLLTGTLSYLPSRIWASNAKGLNRQVIACGHGVNPFFDFDEPIVGYGEISYCDHYVEYGRLRSLIGTKYIVPLQDNFPKIHYRTSKFIENIYKNKVVKFRQTSENIKICYVPTGFSQNFRYGPFRDYEDDVYLKWQKAILSLPYNITYKAHPSSRLDWFPSSNFEKRKLEEIIGNYDLFLVDYFGTAHAIISATDKPIIFFNIGLRNMNPEFIKEFKSRVLWIDIDLEKDLTAQLEKAFKNFNEFKSNFINSFTEKNSINENSKANIVDIIEEILER